MSWILHFDEHLDQLLVSLRSFRLSCRKPADEGLIGLHVFYEIGLGKTVQGSLKFALEKPSDFLVYPELASQLKRANTFAHNGNQLNHGKGTLDWELQFVENRVRCWGLVEKAFLATTVQRLLPLTKDSLQHLWHANPRDHFTLKGRCGMIRSRGIAS